MPQRLPAMPHNRVGACMSGYVQCSMGWGGGEAVGEMQGPAHALPRACLAWGVAKQ